MKAIIMLILYCLMGSLQASPIALTASDGTGLNMTSYEARVVLEGFFAFTELKLTFHNPESRRREGRFQIILPDNAAISRFAMQNDDKLLEGEVVERQLARRAYEDFLHRRQDPALLENDRGNRFNARVFPIAANADKTLIISYSQQLTADKGYTLPLLGIPKLKQFRVLVMYDQNFTTQEGKKQDIGNLLGTISTKQILKFTEVDYQPKADFFMPYQVVAGKNLAMRHGNLVAARLVPFVKQTNQQNQNTHPWVVLVDTSASQAPFLDATLATLRKIKQQLNIVTWSVYSFDQDIRSHGDSLDAVAKIKPLGATRLETALEFLAKQPVATSRLLLVTDAIVTAGNNKNAHLANQISAIAWLQRVDVLYPSYNKDTSLARSVVTASKFPGIEMSLGIDVAEITSKLMRPVRSEVAVKVHGSKWYWPEKLDAIQDGEAIIVFAELENGKPVSIQIDKQNFNFDEVRIAPLLLKREWGRARIERLVKMEQQSKDRDMVVAMREQIIRLSKEERILTSYTALLVLESKADYTRFGIDQKALKDILTVDLDGITVLHRSMPKNFNTPTITRDKSVHVQEEASLREKWDAAHSRHRQATADAQNAMVQRRRHVMSPQIQTTQGGMGMPSMIDRMVNAPMADMSGDNVLGERRLSTLHNMDANVVRTGEEVRLADVELQQLRGQFAKSRTRIQQPREADNEVRPEPAQAQSVSIGPWSGKYAKFQALLAEQDLPSLHLFVSKWFDESPADVMAFIALGEIYEREGNVLEAARAYGSLIDYFPARADIRRWAAGRILRLKPAHWLAVDSLEKALVLRDDHPSGHYLLAWAYWAQGKAKQALKALDHALSKQFNDRYKNVKRILQEARNIMAQVDITPQLRFVLTWETDANDVDLHVYDKNSNHAYYSQKKLSSGGELYEDVTQGYGPENFTVMQPHRFPYSLKVHYYNKGPMGYGMGVLHVLHITEQQEVMSEFRPFVVMQNQAHLKLGTVLEAH